MEASKGSGSKGGEGECGRVGIGKMGVIVGKEVEWPPCLASSPGDRLSFKESPIGSSWRTLNIWEPTAATGHVVPVGQLSLLHWEDDDIK